MHGTRKSFMGGTQLEVARGKEFCKAACRIKNADALQEIGRGRETGGWGFLQAGNSAHFNGDASVGVAF
jgi:hypothetical protein